VIMKKLLGNKGIALIILVVAITIIAIIGAAFVSITGSKFKGFLYQNDSYRASNLANAGIEYAIRYVGDNITLSENTSDFFHNPASFVPVVNNEPNTNNLNSSEWKKFDFPVGLDKNGSFYLSYHINIAKPDDADTNKILYSVGVSGNSTKLIKLKNFLSYASPSSSGLGRLNMVPGVYPSINGNYVYIPIMHLYSDRVGIDSLRLQLDSADSGTKHLKNVRFSNWPISYESNIYPASSYGQNCDSSSPPCFDSNDNSIHIPDMGETSLMTNEFTQIDGHAIRWLLLEFQESGDSLKGTYTLKLNLNGKGTSAIKFTLQ
jgi:hypothetical protein